LDVLRVKEGKFQATGGPEVGKHKLSPFLTLAFAMFVMSASASAAERCFFSSQKLTEDAQNIRLCAMDMGWKVGKMSSFVAAVVIEGKVKIYPKDEVEVCLRDLGGKLQVKAQSLSEDAGFAEWHTIKAKRRKGILVLQKSINKERSRLLPDVSL
jgi:hypothetical protein